MARLNVYVPDELAERARRRGLNVSALTQAAITAELDRQATDLWLDGLVTPRRPVPHSAVLAAVDGGRADFDHPDAAVGRDGVGGAGRGGGDGE